jgi:hypothetical protein
MIQSVQQKCLDGLPSMWHQQASNQNQLPVNSLTQQAHARFVKQGHVHTDKVHTDKGMYTQTEQSLHSLSHAIGTQGGQALIAQVTGLMHYETQTDTKGCAATCIRCMAAALAQLKLPLS